MGGREKREEGEGKRETLPGREGGRGGGREVEGVTSQLRGAAHASHHWNLSHGGPTPPLLLCLSVFNTAGPITKPCSCACLLGQCLLFRTTMRDWRLHSLCGDSTSGCPPLPPVHRACPVAASQPGACKPRTPACQPPFQEDPTCSTFMACASRFDGFSPCPPGLWLAAAWWPACGVLMVDMLVSPGDTVKLSEGPGVLGVCAGMHEKEL